MLTYYNLFFIIFIIKELNDYLLINKAKAEFLEYFGIQDSIDKFYRL